MDVQTILAIVAGIATPLGAAIWPIVRWLEPRLSDIFTKFSSLLSQLETQHQILDRCSNTQNVMAEVIAAQQNTITKGRWLTLIVDDSAVTRRLLLGVLSGIAADFHLTVKDVNSLSAAYEHLPFCNLIILDVYMSDCDEDRARAFIEAAKPCPVIIYTGTDVESIEGAQATITKDTPIDELIKTIKDVYTRVRK